MDQRLLVSGNGRNTSIDKLEYQFEFLSDTLKQMSEQVAQVHQFFEDIKDRVDISLKRPPASKLQSPRAKGQFWIQFPLTTMEQVHDVEQRISTDYTYKRHLVSIEFYYDTRLISYAFWVIYLLQTTKLQKMKRVNPDCKIKKLLSSEVAAKFKCRTLWGIKIADSPFMMLVASKCIFPSKSSTSNEFFNPSLQMPGQRKINHIHYLCLPFSNSVQLHLTRLNVAGGGSIKREAELNKKD